MQAPDRGDIVWLDFDPQVGHEQAGRRPALVVSPKAYNTKTGLLLCCPITNQVKGYPFEVLLPAGIKATGAVLADQVSSLDWQRRNASKLARAPDDVVAEVTAKLAPLMGFKP